MGNKTDANKTEPSKQPEKRPKHVQLRGRRTVEIPHLGVKVTPAPENGKPGVLVELLEDAK